MPITIFFQPIDTNSSSPGHHSTFESAREALVSVKEAKQREECVRIFDNDGSEISVDRLEELSKGEV